MPDDIRELDEQIKKIGLIAIECDMPTNEIIRLNSLLEGRKFLKLIIQPNYLRDLPIEYNEKHNIFQINYFDRPVIEFERPIYNDTDCILKEGRLYYKADKLSPDKSEIINQNEDFVKTAEKLFRWVRNNYPNTKINRWLTTQRTHNWLTERRGRLVNSFNQFV